MDREAAEREFLAELDALERRVRRQPPPPEAPPVDPERQARADDARLRVNALAFGLGLGFFALLFWTLMMAGVAGALSCWDDVPCEKKGPLLVFLVPAGYVAVCVRWVRNARAAIARDPRATTYTGHRFPLLAAAGAVLSACIVASFFAFFLAFS